MRTALAPLGLAIAAGAAHADGPLQGTATWLWETTTQDGNALVEPGETATTTLSVLMEPDPGDGPFVALSAATFNVLGGVGADQGQLVFWEIHNDLDEMFIDPPYFDGTDILDINVGQLTVFGPFTSDNPIDVISFEWQPDAYAPLEVLYSTETLLLDDAGNKVVHVWEGEDKRDAEAVEYNATEAQIAFTVVPAPPAAAALGAGLLVMTRTRRQPPCP